MIVPEPTADDLARDANAEYQKHERHFPLSRLAWIRRAAAAEREREALQALNHSRELENERLRTLLERTHHLLDEGDCYLPIEVELKNDIDAALAAKGNT